MSETSTVPNPGSNEAIQQGCLCPVLDNCRGRGYRGVPGLYVYSEDCPLHWPKGQAEPNVLEVWEPRS